jgi:hypothetical protein
MAEGGDELCDMASERIANEMIQKNVEKAGRGRDRQRKPTTDYENI